MSCILCDSLRCFGKKEIVFFQDRWADPPRALRGGPVSGQWKGCTFVRLQRPGEVQSPSSDLRGALVSHRNLSILDRRFSVVGRRLLRQLVMDMGPVAARGSIVGGDMMLRRPFLAVDLGEPMTVDTKVIWEYLDKAIKVDGAL